MQTTFSKSDSNGHTWYARSHGACVIISIGIEPVVTWSLKPKSFEKMLETFSTYEQTRYK